MACVQSPTKVKESFCCPIRIKSSTVIVDARSSFHHKLFRLPDSIHVREKDFFRKNKKGERVSQLKGSLEVEIKRLSLLGLDLSSDILVVGEGKRGKGEEGRLAWIFLYLGFKKVQFSSIDSFKKERAFVSESFDSSLSQKNQIPWESRPLKTLLSSKESLLRILGQKVFLHSKKKSKKEKGAFLNQKIPSSFYGHFNSSKSLSLKELSDRKVFKWFLNVGEENHLKGTLHFPWKEFLNEGGQPSESFRRKLFSRGFRFKDRILVLSPKGFESMTAVAALYLMGFKGASYLEGGYESLQLAI